MPGPTPGQVDGFLLSGLCTMTIPIQGLGGLAPCLWMPRGQGSSLPATPALGKFHEPQSPHGLRQSSRAKQNNHGANDFSEREREGCNRKRSQASCRREGQRAPPGMKPSAATLVSLCQHGSQRFPNLRQQARLPDQVINGIQVCTAMSDAAACSNPSNITSRSLPRPWELPFWHLNCSFGSDRAAQTGTVLFERGLPTGTHILDFPHSQLVATSSCRAGRVHYTPSSRLHRK